jgi:hypothetical protein
VYQEWNYSDATTLLQTLIEPNLTEKCWRRRRMKRALHRREKQPTTEEEMRVAIKKEW